MIDIAALIRLLSQHGVEFIVIGGVAAAAHGSARATFDLDVVYRRSPENIERVASCLSQHTPSLRGAPAGLPFRFDADTISKGLNFTLDTDLGPLDFLGEVASGIRFEQLLPDAIQLKVFGVSCLCLGLKRLIQIKLLAGRRKDLEAVAELEVLLEESEQHPPNSE